MSEHSESRRWSDMPIDARATADDPAEAGAALRAVCWGTRGSIPSPGPETARHGGNTSCLEIRPPGGRRLIFDAGTGIRRLGERLRAEPRPTRADLFFTHFHWDHVQGVPFFAPLYDPETFIRIHGPPQNGVDVQTLFANQLGPIYFPVPFEALEAQLEFRHLGQAPWREQRVEVAALRVRHSAHTVAYRIRAGGAALAYIPDNELTGTGYPVPDDWYDRLVDFLGGVDLLLHDAMFTEAEYTQRNGWGHSTFGAAVDLAERAGVRRLSFFHHAPERTDAELTRIVEHHRAELADRGSRLELRAAVEGEELMIQREER